MVDFYDIDFTCNFNVQIWLMRLVTTRKYKNKTYSEEQHLVNSRYELLTREQFAVIIRYVFAYILLNCFLVKVFEIDSVNLTLFQRCK